MPCCSGLGRAGTPSSCCWLPHCGSVAVRRAVCVQLHTPHLSSVSLSSRPGQLQSPRALRHRLDTPASFDCWNPSVSGRLVISMGLQSQHGASKAGQTTAQLMHSIRVAQPFLCLQAMPTASSLPRHPSKHQALHSRNSIDQECRPACRAGKATPAVLKYSQETDAGTQDPCMPITGPFMKQQMDGQ